MAELLREYRSCFRVQALPPKGASLLVLSIMLAFTVIAFAPTGAEARHFVTTANKTLPKKKILSTSTAVKRATKGKRNDPPAGARKNYSAKKQFASGFSPLRPEDRLQVRSELEKYIGTRYKWGGTGRTGFDCPGFFRTMYLKLFGIDLPHNARQQFYSSRFTRRSIKSLSIGDLVFFSPTGRSSRINHVGIYLDNGRFIHASSKRGITISSLDDRYWRRRLVSAKSLAHKKLLTQWNRAAEEPQGIAASESRFQMCLAFGP